MSTTNSEPIHENHLSSGWEGTQTGQGLIVRGSQMLATGAAIADELFVTCMKPLSREESAFAISFAVLIRWYQAQTGSGISPASRNIRCPYPADPTG